MLTGVGEAGPEGGEVVLNVEESEVRGNVELGGTRTPYLFNAIEALSQMSYSPTKRNRWEGDARLNYSKAGVQRQRVVLVQYIWDSLEETSSVWHCSSLAVFTAGGLLTCLCAAGIAAYAKTKTSTFAATYAPTSMPPSGVHPGLILDLGRFSTPTITTIVMSMATRPVRICTWDTAAHTAPWE